MDGQQDGPEGRKRNIPAPDDGPNKRHMRSGISTSPDGSTRRREDQMFTVSFHQIRQGIQGDEGLQHTPLIASAEGMRLHRGKPTSRQKTERVLRIRDLAKILGDPAKAKAAYPCMSLPESAWTKHFINADPFLGLRPSETWEAIRRAIPYLQQHEDPSSWTPTSSRFTLPLLRVFLWLHREKGVDATRVISNYFQLLHDRGDACIYPRDILVDSELEVWNRWSKSPELLIAEPRAFRTRHGRCPSIGPTVSSVIVSPGEEQNHRGSTVIGQPHGTAPTQEAGDSRRDDADRAPTPASPLQEPSAGDSRRDDADRAPTPASPLQAPSEGPAARAAAPSSSQPGVRTEVFRARMLRSVKGLLCRMMRPPLRQEANGAETLSRQRRPPRSRNNVTQSNLEDVARTLSSKGATGYLAPGTAIKVEHALDALDLSGDAAFDDGEVGNADLDRVARAVVDALPGGQSTPEKVVLSDTPLEELKKEAAKIPQEPEPPGCALHLHLAARVIQRRARLAFQISPAAERHRTIVRATYLLYREWCRKLWAVRVIQRHARLRINRDNKPTTSCKTRLDEWKKCLDEGGLSTPEAEAFARDGGVVLPGVFATWYLLVIDSYFKRVHRSLRMMFLNCTRVEQKNAQGDVVNVDAMAYSRYRMMYNCLEDALMWNLIALPLILRLRQAGFLVVAQTDKSFERLCRVVTYIVSSGSSADIDQAFHTDFSAWKSIEKKYGHCFGISVLIAGAGGCTVRWYKRSFGGEDPDKLGAWVYKELNPGDVFVMCPGARHSGCAYTIRCVRLFAAFMVGPSLDADFGRTHGLETNRCEARP